MNKDFSYSIFPNFMLNDEKYKSFSAKEFFLYMLLLNRLNISKKNGQKFSDKKGFFIYYTKKQIMKDVRCSHQTVKTLLNNLEKAGLIHKEYQANGLPIKIYVRDIRQSAPKEATKPIYHSETSFDVKKAENNMQKIRSSFGEKKNKPRKKGI